MSYFVEGFKGMEYCTEDELVNNEEMKAKGFDIIPKTHGQNTSVYFVHQNLPYVYAECYFGKVGRFARLIIDKEMFYNFNMTNKTILLNGGKGSCKNRCVPAVRWGTTVDLHRLMGITKEVDHVWGILNIVIPDNLRAASTVLNNKNKEQAVAVKKIKTGMFKISFEEKNELFSTSDLDSLRQVGYKVEIEGKVFISKEFDTKKEALIAIKEYEDRFYQGFAYTVINDMRGRFELKFQQLILRTMTEDDVKKAILKDYANDAYSVYRYNLIPLCQKYGILHNEGRTLKNGDLGSGKMVM